MSRTWMTLLGALMACADSDPSATKDGDGTTEPDDVPPAEVVYCDTLEISQSSLEWGMAIIGESSLQTLTFTNPCADGGAVRLEIHPSGSRAFTPADGVVPVIVEVAPGAHVDVPIAYVADDYEADEGQLNIYDTRRNIDDVVVELTGVAAADQDGDGHDAPEAGGDDCNDFDADVWPGAGDTRADLADDDCDGFIDEDLLEPGDVVISEIFHRPTDGDADAAEWFELENTTDRAIDLANWTVHGRGEEAFQLPAPLVVEPGERVVAAGSLDQARNGNVDAQVAFGTDFSLDDDFDWISLEVDEQTIDSVLYDLDWSQEPGHSMALDGMFVDAAHAGDETYWCMHETLSDSGHYGSPGATNVLCDHLDHDLDGYSVDDGDCDDTDGSIAPGASEPWDGVDNDCDGMVDGTTTTNADGVVRGDWSDQLGVANGLSLSDVDDDGDLEVLVGGISAYDSAYFGGVVYGLEVADFSASSVFASTLQFASVEGSSYYGTLGVLPSHAPDVDGDGADDFLAAGASNYGGMTAVLFFDGNLSGTVTDVAADVQFTNERAYFHYLRKNAVEAVDMDGDGADDVVIGVPNTYDATAPVLYEGVVTVFLGSGLETGGSYAAVDADLYLEGTATSDHLGAALGGSDLDGDGYEDLWVSEPGSDQGGTDRGAIYLFTGSADPSGTGLASEQAVVSIAGFADDDALGDYADPLIDDFDGDGTADLVVSTACENGVFVFWDAGSLVGNLDTHDADVWIAGDSAETFGYSLASGDVDGDGTTDLLVGAPQSADFSGTSGSFYSPGEVSIFSGSLMAANTSLVASGASFTLRERGAAGFGGAITAGDTDGDGADEVFVAAPGVFSGGCCSGVSPAGDIYYFDL